MEYRLRYVITRSHICSIFYLLKGDIRSKVHTVLQDSRTCQNSAINRSKQKVGCHSVSSGLHSLQGVTQGIQGIIDGSIIGGIKGDTRSLDYNLSNPLYNPSFHFIFHVLFHVILLKV